MFAICTESQMPAEIFRFDDLELDRVAFELRRAGRAVPIERIPLELLFVLVEHRGELVTRQEILDRVWGKHVFVDKDNAINTAVRKIRLALRDNPENPRFLHTVPAKGYRFDAQILQGTGADASIAELFPPPSAAVGVRPQQRRRALWIGLAAAVFFFAVYSTRTYLSPRPKGSSGKVMLVVMPFVNMNDDPHQDYFVDGITEEMIAQLGGLDPAHLGVIARTSSMQY
jgi:DNA-binding winged helix-turn-helix (wHTH) protein